ncbi:ubiquinone biosynthesis O-methyltransferase-like [Clavelina lepadiformis]|uniref:ubiquinone biosynthesis O-methyltransferase-like n=1 Tax=Clavelina lepadiformis TaxID=159417 RepID=UPI0040433876
MLGVTCRDCHHLISGTKYTAVPKLAAAASVSLRSFFTKNTQLVWSLYPPENTRAIKVGSERTRVANVRLQHSSSVSEEETERFSQLAKSWWDTKGSMKALHSMNKLRVPFIRDNLLLQGHGNSHTSKPLSGVSILEVGCGAGILSEPLSRLGASVVGLDSSKEVLTVAKSHRGNDTELEDLQYLDFWLEDIVALGTLKFDCVIASEVIEHVNNPEDFIKMCTNVLKPGGSLFASTINRTQISYLLGIFVAEKILNIVPKGTHDWNKLITPTEVNGFLANANCHLRKMLGMRYNPLQDKWTWSSDKDINYIFHATKQLEDEVLDEENVEAVNV